MPGIPKDYLKKKKKISIKNFKLWFTSKQILDMIFQTTMLTLIPI